jgi:hypothetical protein
MAKLKTCFAKVRSVLSFSFDDILNAETFRELLR